MFGVFISNLILRFQQCLPVCLSVMKMKIFKINIIKLIGYSGRLHFNRHLIRSCIKIVQHLSFRIENVSTHLRIILMYSNTFQYQKHYHQNFYICYILQQFYRQYQKSNEKLQIEMCNFYKILLASLRLTFESYFEVKVQFEDLLDGIFCLGSQNSYWDFAQQPTNTTRLPPWRSFTTEFTRFSVEILLYLNFSLLF